MEPEQEAAMSEQATQAYYDQIYRQRGVDEAFRIAADDATKLRRLLSEMLDAVRAASALMAGGFIPPEGESEQFERGWLAACEEFSRSAAAAELRWILEWLETEYARS